MAHTEEPHQCFFPLTALQIGDLQSYVSKLFVFLDHGEKQLVFFVDNQPWTAECHRPKSVELWQLMVTQSRRSPFTNQISRFPSGRLFSEDTHELEGSASDAGIRRLKRKLFQSDENQFAKIFRDIFQHHFRSVVRVRDLSHLLHGCVAFEVQWKHVRGINYLNELQTDTCLALETKLLVKRDFLSFREALAFYGIKPHVSVYEPAVTLEMGMQRLAHDTEKDSEQNTCGRVASTGICFVCTGSTEICSSGLSDRNHTPLNGHLCDFCQESVDFRCNDKDDWLSLPDDSYSAGGCSSEFFDAAQCHLEFCNCCTNSLDVCVASSPITAVDSGDSACLSNGWVNSMDLCEDSSPTVDAKHSDSESLDDACSSCGLLDVEREEPQLYKDTLLVFRFRDPILPFALEKIITADQRLLKMLESGLPSWVVFLQSYPVVSKFYRPWMRAFARTMYVLVSVITVIIGFYDLYKNVPVLKATAARICGPLFDWIEAWEMVSRIKYLLTVLFLQNWEKAFRWLLLILKTTKQLWSMLMMPMAEPLQDLMEYFWPFWSIFADGFWGIANVLWTVVSLLLEYTSGLVQLILWPLMVLLSTLWNIATWILYPFISALWGLVMLPLRLVILLVNLAVAVVCGIHKLAVDIWSLVSSSIQLFSVAGSSQATTLRAAKSSSSTWRLLWHDIFSQVFRAVRSIVNGLVAFLTTCNRHRLSIYNHVSAFILRLAYLVKSAHSRTFDAYHHMLNSPLSHEGGFEDEHIYLEKRVSRRRVSREFPRNWRTSGRNGAFADVSLDIARVFQRKPKVN